MLSEERVDLRWGVERRLEFIEFRLFWEGHVNRSDLIEAFGISVQQASADLNRYQGLAAANIFYDKSAKAYVRGSVFEPLFLQPDAGRYLSQLRSVAEGILDKADAWIGQFPNFDTAAAPSRAVTAATLRSVVASIRRSEAIEIKYQSLSRIEPMWRWVAPHAIGFDGFRWHARAFCEIDLTFKDFVLSRILNTRETRPSERSPEADADWQTQVVLQIGPHPELTETQKKVVGLDYGMRDGKAEISVRRALLYYTLKRLGLDTDPSARRPQDQQIVLLNASELLDFNPAHTAYPAREG